MPQLQQIREALTLSKIDNSADGKQFKVKVDGLVGNDTSWTLFYSLDGGSNWIQTTGDTLTLDLGTYEIGGIQVRQVNPAGTQWRVGANTEVISELPAPVVEPPPVVVEPPVIVEPVVKTSLLTFEQRLPSGKKWDDLLLQNPQDWRTDNGGGTVEIGKESVYGGKNNGNQVLELASKRGAASNLFTVVDLDAGDKISLQFDLSARAKEASAIKVFFDGQLLEVINPGKKFGWEHHSYDLVADGDAQRIELVAVNKNSFGAVIDNLFLQTTDFP
ncbi:MAG: hypothetical protein RL095_2319 [Verrucomicrobiota bacterium]|jgi:hypothetical protein